MTPSTTPTLTYKQRLAASSMAAYVAKISPDSQEFEKASKGVKSVVRLAHYVLDLEARLEASEERYRMSLCGRVREFFRRL